MNATVTDIALHADLQKAIDIAQAIAREHRHGYFSGPHLLKALLHRDVALEPLLVQMDVDVYYLEEWTDVRIENYPKSAVFNGTVIASEDVSGMLDEADNIRIQLNKDELEPMHVLIAMSTPGVSFTYEQLKTFPLQRDALLQSVLSRNGKQALLQPVYSGAKKDGQQQAIARFCTEKTLLAAEKKLDPITGREQEVRMMAEILSRRSKPNVLLLGEPGVGKSALADGFALAIAAGEVPAFLRQARLFELDNGALAAGASYKGEIEERLKSVLKEIKLFGKAILFIDEIHVLMDRQGSFAGAANLLKPELARGEITIIGATTLDEYRKHIEKDEAFARRFELLLVEEPDEATAFRMMKTVMPLYEAHHRIHVPDDTLREAVRLARRYIKDRKLPDAALDLADRSMAALRLVADTGTDLLETFRQEYESLKTAAATTKDLWEWHYKQLKCSVSPIVWSCLESDTGDIKELPSEAWVAELDSIYRQLSGILSQTRDELEKHDVASIVADKTGIPLGKVQAQEKERLLNMPQVLKERIVGQDYAVKAISEAVLESRSGLGKPGQPIGSFFFLGPTGTGKTELAKALAAFLFLDEGSIIRFDMSEFKEEHAAALLYGAPPGYVGYEEGGLLVNKIRQKPYSVVLFDEIEKAHPSVFDIFLQLMDEGKLHDKLGKEGDFSNALVLFTSNIGSSYVVEKFREGEVPDNVSLLNIMSKHFRPEFLGRLTEIVPFAPMTEEMVNRILEIQLKDVYKALDKQQIKLVLTDAAHARLAAMGYTPEYGARPLGGVIRTEVRRPLSKKIISNELVAGSIAALDFDASGNFSWRIENSGI